MTRTLFIPPDLDAENDRWGANCGPGALAAVLGKPIAAVRPAFPWFPASTWTNQRRMEQALHAMGARWRADRAVDALGVGEAGVALVQFEGPWTAPGVDPRRAPPHTHWIGVARVPFVERGLPVSEPMLFAYDVNDAPWFPMEAWERFTLPKLLRDHRRATGWRIRVILTPPDLF